jgi:serine/threonine protein kinase/tetratricopeptide (TPR) repeat protein
MFCQQCGHRVTVTDRHCAECGSSLTGQITPPRPVVPSAPDDRTFAGDSDATRLQVPSDQLHTATRGVHGEPAFGEGDETQLGVPAPVAALGEGNELHGPLTPGEAFGRRYHIVRLLGLGGMGAVYQAWDQELGVLVALKVTRPEIAGDPEGARMIQRRFKQELLLARQVTHKNVVRIHDLGEVNGIKYITMPYIDGEDLASIVAREGTLPLPRVLKIARTLVSGLAAAHIAGVVHRDLKPANIMVDAEGEALITDFGIARSTGAPPPAAHPSPGSDGMMAAAADHTVLGAIVGTIGYMAPEQAKAQPVDQRADIYAAGLILYDMLGGRLRFERAESPIAELTSRMVAAPPRLRTINSAIPETIDRMVDRCLQPDPDARYQTTDELVAELDRIDDAGNVKKTQRHITRRLAASVATIFVALLALTWWLARGRGPAPQPKPVSLLIADFENRTGEPVFSGAVEQALSITMEGASFISAYPRSKAKQIADQMRPGASLDEKMARQVAKGEALDLVLDGTIERSGSGYAIAARALDATQLSDSPRVVAASRTVAASRDDVLAAMARLSSDLRRRLGDRAVPRNDTLPSDTFTAASLDAMRAYVQAQDLQVAGRFPEALGAYKQAVSFDPGFGRAYAGMGVIYGNLKQTDQAEQSYKQAMRYLGRMTEREKYSTLGGYYLLVSHDYDKAVENYEALVARYPADRGGHANLAYAYLNKREMDKAVVEVRKALDLEPANVLQQMNYAMYALYAGDFATATQESAKIKESSGLYPYALLTQARAAAAAGDVTAAEATIARLGDRGADGASMATIARADLAMYEGQYAKALEVLLPRATKSHSSPAPSAGQLVMIAEAQRALGKSSAAASSALKASEASRQDDVVLPAAMTLSDIGNTARAQGIAGALEERLQPQSRAYARLITADLALRAHRLPAALDALRESKQQLDSWLVHVLLGRTYLEAGQAPEALAEFETCLKRQGEATDVFFTDSSTLRYLPPVHYWLARAQETLGDARARQNYEWYVNLRGGTDAADPLLDDAKTRLASLGR